MKLKISINQIKSIKNLTIELPLDKGIYAITGQNASGKSTLVTCASTVFYNMPMNEFFGHSVIDGSFISFELNDAVRRWEYRSQRWSQSQEGNMRIKGFYEGSIIFGNRFRDTNFASLRKLDRVENRDLEVGDEFVRINLGAILHNDIDYYERIFKINQERARVKYSFNGVPYYYEKNGKRVSQAYMSTGENLLVTILHSILLRVQSRNKIDSPYILFLDEIELALHPSSLTRLINFLRKLADEFNMTIYFSTHSIELIRDIEPDNIFFLERHSDDTIEVINPCYPSYATRILYDHFGYDYVILVEDDLAKLLTNRLLKKYQLLNNKLVHVLPCGGWQNVLKLADEVINSNLLTKTSAIIVVLDGDVKSQSSNYIKSKNLKFAIPLNFLPIPSLEKYLKTHLFDNVDHKLFRFLNDYMFHKVSLTTIVDNYRNRKLHKDDSSGKNLYKEIDKELRDRNKTRSELVELVVDYIEKEKLIEIESIKSFLEKELT